MMHTVPVDRLNDPAVLWKFAGYLAGEATVKNAAKWSGVKPADGDALLANLCNRMGKQAS